MRVQKWVSSLSLLLPLTLAGCSLWSAGPDASVPHTENPIVRVQLAKTTPEITILPNADYVVERLDGQETMPAPAKTDMTIALRNGQVTLRTAKWSFQGQGIALESLNPGGQAWVRTAPACSNCRRAVGGVFYEGRIEIYPAEDGMMELVLVLPMEEYLRGVVPSEIGPNSPLEAMCAQAVAARSEAFVALTTQKYAGPHSDICADTGCQVFSGTARRSDRSDEAVARTRGQLLLYKHKPISAYYASNCGGHAEDIRNVWPHRADEQAYWGAAGVDGDGDIPLDLRKEADFRAWLDASPVVYCNPAHFTLPTWTHKNFRWRVEVNADDLSQRVDAKQDIGRVVAIRPVSRGVSGRIIEVEFVGEKGTLRVGPELEIRRMFSPLLKSAAFVVDPKGPAARPDAFVIRGAGSGHGVGMCQTGAIGMANAGKTSDEIIRHYYPRAVLWKLY